MFEVNVMSCLASQLIVSTDEIDDFIAKNKMYSQIPPIWGKEGVCKNSLEVLYSISNGFTTPIEVSDTANSLYILKISKQ
ncbi:MAG: hypothetical protein WD512_04510 [Candidatus Paceibacterota bacterium]